MDFQTRLRFEMLLELFFLEFALPWEGELTEEDRILVCAAIASIFKFIFEPRSIIRNRKYLQLIKANIFDIVIPNAENDLCESVRDLWSFIKSEGALQFLQKVSEWEDKYGYFKEFEKIKIQIQKLSIPKKKHGSFVYVDEEENMVFEEFARFSIS